MSQTVLAGERVALLEARQASQLSALVRRLGGVPLSVPALREEPLPAGPELARFLDRLAGGELAYVVLQTGAGVAALAREARRLEREGDLVQGLRTARTVSRGPKPAAALAELGLRPTYGTASPHTTAELLALCATLPLDGLGVGLVHYGERSEAVAVALERRHADLSELLLYAWRLPEDTGPLQQLVERILAGDLDAVVFTTQVQVRHLFEVAGSARRQALTRALEGRVVTAAVGPTCAAALHEHGVSDVLVPQNPKLGPLLTALASRLAARQPRASEAAEV